MGLMSSHEDTLRRLAVPDETFLESVLVDKRRNAEVSGLDARTHAFVRLGALIALDASTSCYQPSVEDALAAGASVDEIVGALVAALPNTGSSRIVSAAPKLGLAVGYDVDAALEAWSASGL
jgi:4-carboxymuconolactone decarboxylase